MRLAAIGLGYCARYFIRTRGLMQTSTGSSRTSETIAALRRDGFDAHLFDPPHIDGAINDAVRECDALLVSAGPDAQGDPTLNAFEAALRNNARLTRIVYLSTIGVYGDRQGAWIDEDAPVRPTPGRSGDRVASEAAWRRLGEQADKTVFVLRLAGIYGPERNALVSLAQGRARRIVKPGQIFNRIHVEDIARAIEAALGSTLPGGVWNVADDEPSAATEPIVYAAQLSGAQLPPEIPFEDADFTPMARSFWSETKRVSNRRLKDSLGVSLAYPTYREGLDALYAAGESKPGAPSHE